ncbi:MAG: threonine/serine exporter [Clostridiaceae bacterium]|nr:threonine/serine exporter [Clostridiaceae bacterium]
MLGTVLNLVYCFVASLFFALIMNAPKKTLIITSISASLGYFIYISCSTVNSTLGFFAGTIFVAMMGEILARKFKMPATIFIFPAVIPIVPGFGLYQTMLALVQNDITSALEIGTKTILNIAAMAIAIALVSVLAVRCSSHLKKPHSFK